MKEDVVTGAQDPPEGIIRQEQEQEQEQDFLGYHLVVHSLLVYIEDLVHSLGYWPWQPEI